MDGSLRISVAVETGRAASLRVVGLHEWIGPEEPVVFLEQELALGDD